MNTATRILLLSGRTLSRRFADILKGRTAIVYDPQDLTTLFQDAAGILPVYRPGSGAVDPPVGLALDKSLGLELGPEWIIDGGYESGVMSTSPASVLTNTTHTRSQDFVKAGQYAGKITGSSPGSAVPHYLRIRGTNGVGAAVAVVVTGSVYIPASLNTGGFKAVDVADGSLNILITNVRDTWVDFSFRRAAKGSTWTLALGTNLPEDWAGGSIYFDNISVREIKGYHAYQTTTTARPTLSGRYNLLLATETLATQSVTTAATDYTLRFEGTGTVTLSGAATGVKSAGTHTVTCTAGTLTLTVAGSVTKADLRVKRDGSSLPAYQRVDSATTYDTTGFPLYLKRDKVDDDLIVQAPAITGQRAWGSIDTVDIAAATIAAGAYQPFGTISAGEPTCTQWIAIDGALTASEQAVLERYVYSKSKLPVGA